jgi:membrane-associated phospholipid phosphatase
MPADTPVLSLPAWLLLTRLGESQLLLPAFAAMLAWLRWRMGATRVVAVWAAAVVVAAAITTVSKLAFIGWGWGDAALDFTGISGHAMFSFALWPVIVGSLRTDAPRGRRALLLAFGYAVALVIAGSRVIVEAHSVSEVVAGSLLGAAASAAALHWAPPPRGHAPLLLVLGIALWFVATPAHAPPSPTHGWIVRLALALSGHEQPYTREQMHLDHRLGRPPTLR